MAGSRTLKLSILGDVSDLNKSLKTANTDVESFGDKVSDFGKKAGLAFAVAGAAAAAYAGKLLIEGVQSAIADEAAQASLAKTLENVTGATSAQIKATEDYISKTSLANGITDDVLRPSLDRLVRATGDVSEAQRLQTLALDISAGSGKSLETVTNALAKATEGNTGALGKLGVGLDKTEIKTMSMNEITKKLGETFAGQASEKADTFAGKMDRLKIALDEAKESVGTALLPMLTNLVDYIVVNIVPQLNAFVGGLTGDKGAKDALGKTGTAAYDLGSAFRDAASNVGKLFGVFNDNSNTGSQSGLAKLIGWADNIITAFSKVIEFVSYTFALLKVISNPSNWGLSGTETAAKAMEIAGIVKGGQPAQVLGSSHVSSAGGFTASFNTGSGGSAGGGGTSSGGSSGLGSSGSISSVVKEAVGAALPKNITYMPLPDLTPSEALFSALTGTSGNFAGSGVSPYLAQSPNISITVNGALNSEQTARQIVTILNDSQARGTQGASNLITTPGGMGF